MKLEFENPDLNKPVEATGAKRKAKVVNDIKIPSAYTPKVDIDNLDIEITTDVLDSPNPDWDEVLRKWGYDPNVYEIIEPIKVSHWQALNEGQVVDLFSLKAGVRTKRKVVEAYEYKDLVAEVKKHRKFKVQPLGNGVFVVNIADTQFGKADGQGTKKIVEEFQNSIDVVEERIKELRKAGRKLGLLIVAGVGDIIEGCEGQYASQVWNTELNRREQLRIARRLIRDAICRWAKMFNEVIVLAVPGNHGQNSSGYKVFTTPGDNGDVEVFEQIADILSANPEAYGHVKFILPEDDVWVALEVCGKKIGWAHGHITGRSGTTQQKIYNWWKDQAFASTDIGNCDILVTGHYHTLSVIEYDMNKLHIQCPSADDGSDWYHDLKGVDSTRGLLTFTITDGGVNDLYIA